VALASKFSSIPAVPSFLFLFVLLASKFFDGKAGTDNADFISEKKIYGLSSSNIML
jgi:hypothetical protein